MRVVAVASEEVAEIGSGQEERFTMTTSQFANDRPQPLLFVLMGGLLAGAFDIVYACLFWALKAGVPAQRIFQSVAAGLLGEASFQGGWGTAALGLALHFLIATTIALVYYAVALRWSLLWQEPLLCGAIYGLLVYGVMNYIVVPLSAASSGGSKNGLWVGLSILVHMVLIGIPCAIFARRAVQARKQVS
jgi:hypothetical protein